MFNEFVVGNRKDFLDGWHIHAFSALANSFDSTFTKWLMQQETLILVGLL
jgi:hypothetical protein